jgi:hypothetical protein
MYIYIHTYIYTYRVKPLFITLVGVLKKND